MSCFHECKVMNANGTDLITIFDLFLSFSFLRYIKSWRLLKHLLIMSLFSLALNLFDITGPLTVGASRVQIVCLELRGSSNMSRSGSSRCGC